MGTSVIRRKVLKRPLGFTLLALALAWVSIGGFGLAYWAATTQTGSVTSLAFGALGIVYGVSSLWSAVGLWRVRAWAWHPLLVWALASLAACWLPFLVSPNQPSRWPPVLGTLLMAGFLLVMLPYVRARSPQPT